MSSEAAYGAAIGNATYFKSFTTAVAVSNVSSSAAVGLISGLIDAKAVTAENGSVNLYDSAAPTVGTTEPNISLPYIAGVAYPFSITTDDTAEGHQFANALSIAVTQELCGGGNTAPSAAVKVRLNYSK